jgi:thiol-disulfide isomerase/thioredoxin
VRARAAIALAALAAGCASTPEPAPARAGKSLAGVEAKCASDGAPFDLGAGGDVRLVELWATWCAPCVKALPLWNELARAEDLAILAVSIDDEREAPLAFAKKLGLDLPILWDPFGQRIGAAVPLGGVVPTTLVLDCEGNVRHTHEGFQGPQVVEQVAAQVRELRRESTCKPQAELAVCAP